MSNLNGNGSISVTPTSLVKETPVPSGNGSSLEIQMSLAKEMQRPMPLLNGNGSSSEIPTSLAREMPKPMSRPSGNGSNLETPMSLEREMQTSLLNGDGSTSATPMLSEREKPKSRLPAFLGESFSTDLLSFKTKDKKKILFFRPVSLSQYMSLQAKCKHWSVVLSILALD
ncbi:hypothetical protein CLUG_04286 [Clavispora lusitaniae ATCC 42720]|uniref:Uncharacterized protein n=1 Tax=Clavispora lusitaniae (strain ATCC 42720) TaxID=306902 RepID=C4Y7V8_CLAL4|nr:uncharacterized protein CLUG_04286 [Clavispora lusitaniae ATCC 42720]EEQ40158.1 hypothetical protein CLUG_04286 [Clavispora lusitaniae ATCC 42720]